MKTLIEIIDTTNEPNILQNITIKKLIDIPETILEEVNKNTELDNTDKKLHISDVIKRTKYTFDEVSKPGSLSREKPISTFADSLKEAEDWFRNNYKGWIYQIVNWKQEYV